MNIRQLRRAAALLLLTGAAFSAAACGSSQTAVSSSAPAASSAAVSSSRSTAASASSSGTDADTVVVYSPHDAEPLNAGITAFMAKYPDIKVKVLAAGTGELCEQIASEADAPVADVFWGGGADSMEAYSEYFDVYVSASDAVIDSQFKDPQRKWVGESPLPMVIIYNKKLLAEAGIAEPASWSDCLNPALKGRIAYASPAKSGSAYTQLCTMILANGGKTDGWNYVEKFVANLGGNLLDSSGKCHKLVASGEYLVGITIEKSAVLYGDDPNIGYCYPSEGTSAVPDAVAIIRNCPHPENARLFADFVTSYECQTEQSTDWGRRPVRSDLEAPAGLLAIADIHLVDYDVAWSASEKSAILERFSALMGS